MNITEKTIAAIATPQGSGGVAIVRISGNDSLRIASQFVKLAGGYFNAQGKESNFTDAPFCGKAESLQAPACAENSGIARPTKQSGATARSDNSSCVKLTDLPLTPRFMHLCKIDEDDVKDVCLCVYFKAPHSYTGEDVVEVQCHGGVYIASKILDLCLKHGAHLAEAGEFSKRAFINGKLSLDSAESVIDLINCKSAAEARAAFSLYNGELFKVVSGCCETLLNTIAEVEVNLDYPEHDISYQTQRQVKSQLKSAHDTLTDLLATERHGQLLTEGARVLILGKPNVGKSSLLNAMLNYDRAIVTEIAGTTRDAIDATYIYKDIKFNITDTAGIHKTADKVENIGIERAKLLIKSSDFIIFMLDALSGITREDEENFALLKDIPYVIAVNKIDEKDSTDYSKLNSLLNCPQIIKISAKNKQNITELKEFLYKKFKTDIVAGDLILTNKRHVELIKRAVSILENALENTQNASLDMLALDIREAWTVLGEITGNTTTESVIDAIFSKFCLGK